MSWLLELREIRAPSSAIDDETILCFKLFTIWFMPHQMQRNAQLFSQIYMEFLAAREPHFGPCHITRRTLARYRCGERFELLRAPDRVMTRRAFAYPCTTLRSMPVSTGYRFRTGCCISIGARYRRPVFDVSFDIEQPAVSFDFHNHGLSTYKFMNHLAQVLHVKDRRAVQ
jgi:hypothetical protein